MSRITTAATGQPLSQDGPGPRARVDELIERNACNEQALADLRAAHDALRRRYEIALAALRALGAVPVALRDGRA